MLQKAFKYNDVKNYKQTFSIQMVEYLLKLPQFSKTLKKLIHLLHFFDIRKCVFIKKLFYTNLFSFYLM